MSTQPRHFRASQGSLVGLSVLLGAWILAALAFILGTEIGERVFGVSAATIGVVGLWRVWTMGLILSDRHLVVRELFTSNSIGWDEISGVSIGPGRNVIPTDTVVIHLRDGRDRSVQSVARSSLTGSSRSSAELERILSNLRQHLLG